MQQLMNTLYLTTPGTYVKREGESIEVHIDGEKQMEIPFIHLNGIVCFGNILISPGIINKFAGENRPIVWHDGIGRFKGRLVGPTNGNVLLRKAQFEATQNQEKKFEIARDIIVGKIRNSREVIQRAVRNESINKDKEQFIIISKRLAHAVKRLDPDRPQPINDLDTLRGIEGNAAKDYFSVFDNLIQQEKDFIKFVKRTRRPPRDPINAMLSFLYTILLNDCVAALEGVGLDPQFGFLHEIRPGKPALALDLMEELRPILVDRLVLTLINRKQIRYIDFDIRPGGSVQIKDKPRKEIIIAYQERKSIKRKHPVLDQQVSLGLIPHVQARIMARFIRGDIEQYLPFYFK